MNGAIFGIPVIYLCNDYVIVSTGANESRRVVNEWSFQWHHFPGIDAHIYSSEHLLGVCLVGEHCQVEIAVVLCLVDSLFLVKRINAEPNRVACIGAATLRDVGARRPNAPTTTLRSRDDAKNAVTGYLPGWHL
jgi:hypothetical protein